MRARERRVWRARALGMVIVTPGESAREASLAQLPEVLAEGDVVVVNDAATLPASLCMTTSRGDPVELRLFSLRVGSLFAFALGPGNARLRTEARSDPPGVDAGSSLYVRGEHVATVLETRGEGGRLWRIDALPALRRAIYREGVVVQYAHVPESLALWDVQTLFASRPVAGEMPSAAAGFDLALLSALRRRGISVCALTHAAGLSSSGRAETDAQLPLPERYRIPGATAQAVRRARAHGGRVIAIGTTVARALEAAHEEVLEGGEVRPIEGEARGRLGRGAPRRVVDAILSGLHEEGTSHHDLLGAFASDEQLTEALRLAEERGLFCHEFGDAMLVFGAERCALGRPRAA